MPAVSKVFSPFPDLFRMPFFYASLSSLKVYHAVPAAGLGPYLGGTTLKPATFTDLPANQGVVTVEFQNYTGHGGTLLETCNEVEFNILAYPASRADRIAPISLGDFIRGMEQTKSVGGFRVYVPCDNPFAIRAGREVFGEPKFQTTFAFQLPTPNLPDQRTWTYTVNDPAYAPPAGGPQPEAEGRDLHGQRGPDRTYARPARQPVAPGPLQHVPGIAGRRDGRPGRVQGPAAHRLAVEHLRPGPDLLDRRGEPGPGDDGLRQEQAPDAGGHGENRRQGPGGLRAGVPVGAGRGREPGILRGRLSSPARLPNTLVTTV